MAALPTGPTNYKVKLVQLGDPSDIQVALNNIVYGTDSVPSGSGGISADSLYGNLANKVSPTFTGTVVLPSTTSIGNVSSAEIAVLDGLTASTTELNYVDGVTSSIQTQFDNIPKVDNFWFGDGSDGTVVISSGTTTLTRDMYYQNLSISGTGKLNPAGFRIFVKDTLSLSSASSAAITFSPTGGSAVDTGAYYGKSNFGAAATDVVAPTSYLDQAWVSAAGGGNSSSTVPVGAISWRRPAVTFYAPFATGTINTGAGGAGGANSVLASPTRAGGRGGTGGTGAFIYANTIALGTANANDGIIYFPGGTGADGTNNATGTDCAGAGGGGGGQGGVVYMVYKTITGSMASGKFLVDCSGGNGGAGGSATGTGSSPGLGGQGGASGLMVFCNIKTGVMTIPSTPASLPTAPVNSTAGTGRSYKATPA